MKTVNIAEAKATLSELVRLASAGETITIAQRGKPVARLTAEPAEKKRVDLDMLRRVAAQFPPDQEPTEAFIRRMRDDERY
jgi:prevent-host-death family protein